MNLTFAETNWKMIAEHLYEALAQMQARRGVHIDDVDLVLDAKEEYEQALLYE